MAITIGSGWSIGAGWSMGSGGDAPVDTVNNKMWYRVAGGAWQG